MLVRAIDVLPVLIGRGRRREIDIDVGANAGAQPPSPSATEGPIAPPPAVVSTGFARQPAEPGLPAERTLAQGTRYQFFIGIGRELASDAIDTGAARLPDLPVGTILQVALFGFDGELVLEPGVDVGELRLLGDGTAMVETQPGGGLRGGSRLYLPVTTPDHPGIFHLRCNIYCRQTLLQSRLVEVQVTAQELTVAGRALQSVIDFAVVSELRPERVESLQPRSLSVLINDNGNGTHGFRFFGGTEFKHDATLGPSVLEPVLEKARARLRAASWGAETEPTVEEFARLQYRYAEPSTAPLSGDLIALARTGKMIWDTLVDQLAGDAVDDLVARMKTPGIVEVANRESLDLLVPAAVLYDYPLNPEDAHLTICETFTALIGKTPLAGTPCFQGACPAYEDPRVVCPSGFWGFRHQIGYVSSLSGGEPDDARDQELTIVATPSPVFTVGASQDPLLTRRDDHLARVQALAGNSWHFAWGRNDLFDLFKTTAPSIVYLYGHGGTSGETPHFDVGAGDNGPILRVSLRGRADWRATRPLVFLNGCDSAALAPDSAFSYATGFLQTAHASAVIGTEIAVFERLAVTFAEEWMQRFVVQRQSLGEALLGARMALLEQGVPLGLVYLAFGPAELRLAG
jgi:hypothetical protein